MLLDAAVNAVPLVILAYFVALTLLRSPWEGPLLVDVLTHVLTMVPIVLLVVATYAIGRVVERDAARA